MHMCAHARKPGCWRHMRARARKPIMFEQFALGVFYPIDSVLHRLRARTKLLALAWLVGFISVANQFNRVAPYAVLVGMVLLAAALSGVGLGHIWRRMRVLVLLTL